MSCAGCNLLSSATSASDCKKLQNGLVVCTACPDWRFECECRAIVAMPDLERKAHYIGVAKTRGDAAAKLLVEAVNKYRRAAREKS